MAACKAPTTVALLYKAKKKKRNNNNKQTNLEYGANGGGALQLRLETTGLSCMACQWEGGQWESRLPYDSATWLFMCTQTSMLLCGKFQTYRHPCFHVIVAYSGVSIDFYNFVDLIYSIQNIVNGYKILAMGRP